MKLLQKTIITILSAVCILVILVSGAVILAFLHEYRTESRVYASLEENIQMPTIAQDDDTEGDSTLPSIDFDALKAINPDIVGWILIPDTRINYPIVKRENDNSYYLNHLFDGTENRAGCIFLDTRCSFGDPHVLIHGHNMANGSMFRDLNLFKNQQFFQEHPYYYLFTEEDTYVVEVFAGSILQIGSPVWQLSFSNTVNREQWLSECWRAVSIRRSLALAPEDTIITLSTCTYEYKQARWVIQGRIQRAENLSPKWLGISWIV